MVLAFIVFFLIFSLLILIHEFGHFIAAKRNGVRVDEFGAGFPPKIYSRKYKGTEYSINLIPFGGFVRIPGSEYDEFNPKDKGSFANKKPRIKFSILTGGIFMNLVLSIILYYVLFIIRNFTSLPIFLLDDFNFRFGSTITEENVIIFVPENTPFKTGDKILSLKYVDSKGSTQQIIPSETKDVVDFISTKEDAEILFNVKNVQNGEIRDYAVRTYYNKELKRNMVGIGLGEAVVLKYDRISDKILSPFLHSYNVLSYTSKIFGSMISTSVKTKNAALVAESVTGPVGIFFIVEAILKIGGWSAFLTLLDFMALLSLSLAVMNILPFPGLDGGHLVFVIYEAVFKKLPPLKLMRWTSTAGMSLLIVLAILIAFKDYFMFK